MITRATLALILVMIFTELFSQTGLELSPTSVTISPSSMEEGVQGKIIYSAFSNNFLGHDGTKWNVLNSAEFGDTITQTIGPHNFANMQTGSSVVKNERRYMYFEFDSSMPHAFLDVTIPVGAKVTGLNAAVYDNHLLDNITVELNQNLLNHFDQPLSFTIASVTSSSSDDEYVKLSTEVALPTINNGDEYYTVNVYAEDLNGLMGQWPDDALRLVMVQIEYVLVY